MIESKFTFLQMQVEGSFLDPTESEQARFGKTPEALNPIHMDSASDKFILPMIDSKMFAIAHIDQPIVPTPSIRIDHTVKGNLATNNRLQCGFPAVSNEFGVDLPIALENAKDDRFAVGSTAPFPLDTSCAKIRFIHFDLACKRRLSFTEFCDSFSKSLHIPVDRVAVQPSQEGHL